MNPKILLIAIIIMMAQLEVHAEKISKMNGDLTLPSLDVVLEEVKFNCSEFKPNLITKFIWREGPTRDLLYKKCLEQNEDDENFTKYNETMINDSNISELSKDLESSQTRLTIYTLTSALKGYLTDPSTSNDKMVFIKKAVKGFRQHYKEKKEMIDVEIKTMKNNENLKNQKMVELLTIIEENELELDTNIESTLKYMEFVIKDRNAYVKAHEKFLPKIYVEPKYFEKANLSKYECTFLKFNFNNDWKKIKKELNLMCSSQ